MSERPTAENDAGQPLEPTFGLIGGPECPTCLGRGLRCHPDGGLIACNEGCARCDDAVRQRAEVLAAEHPVEVTEEGALRILADLGYRVIPPGSGDTQEVSE